MTAAVNEAPVQLTAPNGTIYMVFSASWCGNPNYQLGRSTYNGGPVLSQTSWSKFNGAIFSQANGQTSTAHNGLLQVARRHRGLDCVSWGEQPER